MCLRRGALRIQKAPSRSLETLFGDIDLYLFSLSHPTSRSPRFRDEAPLGDPNPPSGGHTSRPNKNPKNRPRATQDAQKSSLNILKTPQTHPRATQDAQRSCPNTLLLSFLPPSDPKIDVPGHVGPNMSWRNARSTLNKREQLLYYMRVHGSLFWFRPTLFSAI